MDCIRRMRRPRYQPEHAARVRGDRPRRRVGPVCSRSAGGPSLAQSGWSEPYPPQAFDQSLGFLESHPQQRMRLRPPLHCPRLVSVASRPAAGAMSRAVDGGPAGRDRVGTHLGTGDGPGSLRGRSWRVRRRSAIGPTGTDSPDGTRTTVDLPRRTSRLLVQPAAHPVLQAGGPSCTKQGLPGRYPNLAILKQLRHGWCVPTGVACLVRCQRDVALFFRDIGGKISKKN